jgi:hypothetical protein
MRRVSGQELGLEVSVGLLEQSHCVMEDAQFHTVIIATTCDSFDSASMSNSLIAIRTSGSCSP